MCWNNLVITRSKKEADKTEMKRERTLPSIASLGPILVQQKTLAMHSRDAMLLLIWAFQDLA